MSDARFVHAGGPWTTLVDAGTLKARLESRDGGIDLVLIDCRFSLMDTAAGRRAWQEGHIPGACHADLDRDLSGTVVAGHTGRHPLPDREIFAAFLRNLGVSPDTQLVAYDSAGGAFASRLWWLSRWIGHERVAVLDGGWFAWLEIDGRVETREPAAPAPGTIEPGAPTVELVDFETVRRAVTSRDANGGDTGLLLLDAREEDRYAGRHEPIDPVAGHIPGARNMPFSQNLDERGRFLDPQRLRERYGPVLGEAGERGVAVYCGSGVTAAHDLLAVARAGLPLPALYAGSFSEWVTRDGGRSPVARRED